MLLVLAAGWLFRDRLQAGRTAAWDRPETAEEGRLLTEAAARPSDRAAHFALGRYYMAARRPFEALWSLGRVQQDDRLEVVLATSVALEAASLRQRALAFLDEAASRHPASAALAARRAELQLRLGQPELAIRTLRGTAGSVSLDIALLLGRSLEAAGRDSEAAEQYRRCINRGSLEAQVRLGRLLGRLGQTRAGRAALEAAHRRAPADPAPCYELGMSFWRESPASNWHGGWTTTRDSAAEDPPDELTKRAVEWFEESLRAAPSYQPAHLALGRMALSHHLWKMAASHLEEAVRLDPRDPQPLLALADLLAATGYTQEAHERRGLALVMQGKLLQALAEFRAAKAAAPGSRDAAILISQALIQMERSPEAAAEIQAAADLHPQDAELKERLAQLYIDALSRDAARRVCTAWLESDPRAAKPHWLLGRIAAASAQQRHEAIDQYERALRLAPADPEFLFALGDALSQPGARQNIARALDRIGQAVERAPREPRYRYRLGVLLQQLGQPEAACRQFLRALDLDPNMTAAYTNLIQIASPLHQPGQAALFSQIVREQQEAMRTDPPLRRRVFEAPGDPTPPAVLARYLVGHGDLQSARAQWEVVATLKPEDREARRELARLNRILQAL